MKVLEENVETLLSDHVDMRQVAAGFDEPVLDATPWSN